jgi:hypothetical protein
MQCIFKDFVVQYPNQQSSGSSPVSQNLFIHCPEARSLGWEMSQILSLHATSPFALIC